MAQPDIKQCDVCGVVGETRYSDPLKVNVSLNLCLDSVTCTYRYDIVSRHMGIPTTHYVWRTAH